jgi:hypothetical protein
VHKAGAFFFVCAGLLGLALLLPRSAAAAWPADPLVNVPVCTAPGDQLWPASAADGPGGAIMPWHDVRSGNYDIYAQRLRANGQLGGDAWADVPPEVPFALEPGRPGSTWCACGRARTRE